MTTHPNRSNLTVSANGHIAQRYQNLGALSFPIYQTSNFKYDDAGPYVANLNGGPETKQFKYSRYTNPTEAEALRILCLLEGADTGLLVSSGMAAVTLIYHTFLNPGDHVIISENSYYRSYSVLVRSFEKIGVSVSILRARQDVAELMRPHTRLVHVESPSNYLLRIYDLADIAALCKARGVLLSVDNTLATPINQTPLQHGADLVIHSASKYLGGHNDIVCGAVLGREELISQLAEEKGYSGAAVDPFASFLLLRGLKTLGVRIKHVNDSALQIATELSRLDEIEWVSYPGCPGHPDDDLVAKYLSGSAGVFYASLAPTGHSEPDDDVVIRFLNQLEICVIASSFGGTETLARPANMVEFPDHTRLIRFSVGLEHPHDIIDDVKASLKALHA